MKYANIKRNMQNMQKYSKYEEYDLHADFAVEELVNGRRSTGPITLYHM